MKQAAEYRQHASDCRAIAAGMSESAHREQLLKMAAKWEELARDREAQGRVMAPLDGERVDGE